MKKAVIYTRVSTDEQANFGFSLRHQYDSLIKYCQYQDIEVIKHFEDDHSAKTFDRPEFLKLEQFCKANKKDIDLLLFLRWDRFSRNCEFALTKIRVFQNIGIEINSIENPINYSSPDYKVMLALYLSTPEVENDKISIRTIEGSRRARSEGCWTGQAPFGYDNIRIADKSTLKPNKDAQLVVKIFELLATGLHTTEHIRKSLQRYGLNLKKQAVLNLTKNIVYTGKIYIKPYKKEDGRVVEGLHPPIISEDLFIRVQEIIAPRNHIKDKPKAVREEFPLRGHLKCRVCGGNLTGSASKSRNGDKHLYYHCQKGCKERFRADDANADFERLLKKLEFNSDVAELYLATIKEIFSERRGNKEAQISKLIEEVAEKSSLIDSVEDKYYSNKIDEDQFRNSTSRYKAIIRDKQAEIEALKHQDTDTLKHFNYCVSFLSDIADHYKNCNIHIKAKIVGSIFSEKLVYCENKYRTTDANSFFLLFDTVKADLGIDENKKADVIVGLSTKAPEAGLEPATL